MSQHAETDVRAPPNPANRAGPRSTAHELFLSLPNRGRVFFWRPIAEDFQCEPANPPVCFRSVDPWVRVQREDAV